MTELVKYRMYFNAYSKELDKAVELIKRDKESDNDLITPKLVFLAVKTMILKPAAISNEELQSDFVNFVTLKEMISYLTPKQFMNIFPVSKEYDGDRFGIKDYFYTMEYINGLDVNESLGDKAMEFLMEYTNDDIWKFNVLGTVIVNSLRKAEGHIDMFEEFMARNGADTPNTFKNNKGEPMYVKNGKPVLIEGYETNSLKLVQ